MLSIEDNHLEGGGTDVDSYFIVGVLHTSSVSRNEFPDSVAFESLPPGITYGEDGFVRVVGSDVKRKAFE